ncbi:MAG: ubiquitin-specific protease otu1 [Thelocarpon superellum]|nr:MAG: ubiquitin-specific protease otu1 [Thelocarpon superellum]
MMRIRLRGPSGSSVLSIGDTESLETLLEQISEKTSISHFDLKIGYPPQALRIEQYETSSKLADLGVKLDGEQLIVSGKEEKGSRRGGTQRPSQAPSTASHTATTSTSTSTVTSTKAQDIASTSFSFTDVPGSSTIPSTAFPTSASKSAASSGRPALTLSCKEHDSLSTEPPELPLPSHHGTLTLRIMPDDNSCMFRAVGSAMMGSLDSMTELRSLVAATIQADPTTYSPAVLDQASDEYCRWIQTEYSWGGGIELSILSQHFDVEICSIDVQSLRVDRFNEGRPTRCILVYSGIHYDTIALSPSSPPHTHADAPPEFDTKVFDAADDLVLSTAVRLCDELEKRHYYTDTKAFALKCNVCGASLTGEKGAADHAAATGHADFGEAGVDWVSE